MSSSYVLIIKEGGLQAENIDGLTIVNRRTRKMGANGKWGCEVWQNPYGMNAASLIGHRLE